MQNAPGSPSAPIMDVSTFCITIKFYLYKSTCGGDESCTFQIHPYFDIHNKLPRIPIHNKLPRLFPSFGTFHQQQRAEKAKSENADTYLARDRIARGWLAIIGSMIQSFTKNGSYDVIICRWCGQRRVVG